MRAWVVGLAVAAVLASACDGGASSASAGTSPRTPAASGASVTTSPTGTTPTTQTTPTTTPTTTSTRPRPATTTATGASSAVGTCVERMLATLSATARAGQVLLVGVPATDPLPDAARLAELHVGGIFLRGRVAGSATLRSRIAAAQRTARSDGTLPLFVSADEEGGLVQTIRGGTVPPFPAALVQGGWSTATLRTRTTTWATQIAALGVNLDLAPVADTVPASLGTGNPPIGAYRREYGMTSAAVGRAIGVVVPALTKAHVGATVKHFPGLGRVRYNTDTSARAVDATTNASDSYLQPFVTGMKAGAVAVMVSSARYPKLDANNPAMWSQKIITGLLRGGLGWSGLVVSDDLGQAVAASSRSVASRAAAFLAAGGDLVLTVRPEQASTMRRAIAAAAAAHASWRRLLDNAVRHVLAAKISLGLVRC
jgi:beta-N-acetylhexosaminidase